MNDEEVWKTYPKIEWLQGSNLGRVRTLDRYVNGRWGKTLIKGRVLKQRRMKNGYMYVGFRANGKTVYLRVHRVIAMCFLPNPNSLPQVNHKDCDRTDNHLNNLEWCDNSYNMKYREKYGISNTESRGHRIIAINLKTLEVLYFKSQHEAARQLGANQGSVNGVLKGKRNKCSGFWFCHADENAVENTRVKLGNEVAAKVETLLKENQN